MALQYKSEHEVNEFNGLLTEYKDLREVPDGYTPDALNWITQTNRQGIELRRGSALLGLTRRTGTGKVTGLGIGRRFDGSEVPFFSFGTKLCYYDADSDDTSEVGSDLLGTAADGDTVSIFPYSNIAGSWVYASSPRSSIFKIPTANPGSAVNQNTTTYRGFLTFGQSRAFLRNRHGTTAGNADDMGLYASCVDKVDLSQYAAQVTGESVGASGSTAYSGTLAQISGVKTAMFVVVSEAGGETLTDDRNGGLVGSLGSTGTINYATGAYSVTFNHTTTGAVTVSYYYEDATSGGVCDFAIADPSDRAAGEGNYFPQFDGGGPLKSVWPLATVFYCFHELKTWQVSIPVDDESGTDSISTNLPFREKMGVKSEYGAFAGEQGIYFLNTADPNKPEFMRLELYTGATTANIAAPKLLSKEIDFSAYAYDEAVVHEWGDYVLLCLEQIRNGAADDFNSRMFILNKKSGSWDVCDNPASRLATYNGALIAGDPLTPNVFKLFSGFDDDNNLITNHWTGGSSDLGLMGQKRFTRFVIEGLIQSSQSFAIDFAYDGGDFIETFIVAGDGSYVDTGRSIAVGSYTTGSKITGGDSAIVTANPYQVEIRVQSDRFQYVRPRFRALGGGYLSVHRYAYKDIRQKALGSLPVRRG